MNASPQSDFREFLKSRAGLVLLGFLAVAAFFVWTEHSAHLFGALPYLLLFACPLMHLFMHHGHGGHGHSGHGRHDAPNGRDARTPDKERRP